MTFSGYIARIGGGVRVSRPTLLHEKGGQRLRGLTFGVPLDVLVQPAVHRDGRDRVGLVAAAHAVGPAAAQQGRRRVGVLVRLGAVVEEWQRGWRG